jgi:transposase InsO family protein
VPEACRRLGIGESRFHDLRGAWLQEALELLEPRPLGRPPRAADPAPLPHVQPIDGVFPYLLSIRDLASHCQLAWCPVRGQTAADVLPVLHELFALYGPPLVLKHDNGSAFLAGITQQALLDALVAQLFSPPGQPQYNGAVERANGVLKTYTHLHAQAAGHPFRWTSEDLHHAQDLANTVSRPRGAGGLSPAEAWQQRTTITPEERQAFTAALSAHRQQAAQELGVDLSAELNHADRTRLDRLALSATLQDLGYLSTQRVRRPPKKAKRLSRKKLARRVARYHRQAAGAESAAENSTPAQSPEPARIESDNSASPLLAGTPPSDTMLAATAGSGLTAAPPTPPQAVPSARRERTFTSWLRRTLTPLLPFSKTANISR